MRLLIVEDNAELAEALVRAFARHEVACETAGTGEEAEALLAAVHYEAMILDLGLPDEDGLSLLKRLRTRQRPLPVIILTARGRVEEKVAGLQSGADDYLVKPFDFAELQARVESVLRRRSGLWESTLERGNVRLVLPDKQVVIAEAPASLSIREIELLELLLRRPGRVLTKRAAEDQLFGSAEPPGSNAVEVYVHRLRRRLADAAATITIETVRGVGYLVRDLR